MINVGCEAIEHLRNEKEEYLKNRINELVIHSKNKNIRLT
jgi:hypothetical protein